MSKSKLKTLKKRENQELDKSFEELAQELENETKGNAKKYIPEMCQRAEIENPEISKIDVRLKIIERLKGVIHIDYIIACLPKEYKDQEAMQWGYMAKQKQMENLERAKSVSPTTQNDITPRYTDDEKPVKSWTTEEYEEQHPHTEETPFEAIGEINRSIARLWTNLTGKKNMAHMEDDIKKDHIIPTRERFKDIVNGSSKVERDFLYNWLVWLDMVIKDRIEIVEKSDKTAYDTREE